MNPVGKTTLTDHILESSSLVGYNNLHPVTAISQAALDHLNDAYEPRDLTRSVAIWDTGAGIAVGDAYAGIDDEEVNIVTVQELKDFILEVEAEILSEVSGKSKIHKKDEAPVKSKDDLKIDPSAVHNNNFNDIDSPPPLLVDSPHNEGTRIPSPLRMARLNVDLD